MSINGRVNKETVRSVSAAKTKMPDNMIGNSADLLSANPPEKQINVSPSERVEARRLKPKP